MRVKKKQIAVIRVAIYSVSGKGLAKYAFYIVAVHYLLFGPTFYIFLMNVFPFYFTGGSSGYCHGMCLASSELTCYVFTKFDCELVWQI